jgi:DNA-binding NarL/FixJ family response regulator
MKDKYILLIDDHAMFLSGMSVLIGTAYPQLKLIEATSLDESLNKTVGSVDLIFLDINLTKDNGIEGIASLKQKWPMATILVLSAQDDLITIRRAITQGATGFISKKEVAANVISTIQLVLSGNFPEHEYAKNNGLNKQLTPRQKEILALLHEGLSNKLIADRLSLSYNTVRRHVQDILSHFEVSSRAEVVYLSGNKKPK